MRRHGFSSGGWGRTDGRNSRVPSRKIEMYEKGCLVLAIVLPWLDLVICFPALDLPSSPALNRRWFYPNLPFRCLNSNPALPCPSSPSLHLLCSPALYLQIACAAWQALPHCRNRNYCPAQSAQSETLSCSILCCPDPALALPCLSLGEIQLCLNGISSVSP